MNMMKYKFKSNHEHGGQDRPHLTLDAHKQGYQH